MNDNKPIPPLDPDQEHIAKIRRQLEMLFIDLRLVHDVVVVCGGACGAVHSNFDDEVEHVLRRCASDRIHAVLQTVTEIVERFGGKTEMSKERDDED